VTLVLGARIKTEGLSATLREQQAPPNGAVALIDGASRVIARTSGDDYLGRPMSAALADASSGASEGSWRGPGRDGTDNYAAFSRSARTGLMVALGLPTEEIDGPIRRILWTLAGWWVAVLGTGAGLGLLLGGVVVRALTAASRASMALAKGEPIALSSSRIAEIDDLATGLRQASAALEARNRERDEASRLKDEFLMTVSHELRTPLTAICGWSRMLTTGHIREAQRGHALEAIDRNASALRQLVDDLLDVSRIVSGRLRLDVQPVALGDVIGAAVDSVRPAADAKSIDIATRIDARAASVNGDPGRLQQVMWNLLSNAVRYTPSGGRIDITAEAADGDVEIAVIDSGSGVRPDFLPHVFERFRQGETGPTRAHGGLGLGLAIVRHLVELHGGTVRAENNTPGPGATFRIRLPLRVGAVDVRDEGVRLDQGRGDARGAARLDHLNVLVVDHDPHARDLFTVVLENAGADVRATQSVTDALGALETWSADALVVDIDTPNQDLQRFVRQVRARQLADSAFVAIAVTAQALPDDRRRALDAGFQWQLSKPIDPDELVSVLATLRAPAADVA
jgi:signal transduction histidine kinase/ActR/RegA family two-component response regulator